MTVLKRSRRHYALIGISVLLLIPIALAAFAPLLAPIPAQAVDWTAPPLPERDEPLPDFQHLLDPLPLVVRDLPDAASQDAVAIYDATSFTDHASAQRMVTAAEAAIELPASLEASWRAWLADPQSSDVPGPVLESLQDDPLNADRLSNLAVAMYVEVLTRGSRAFDSEGVARARQAMSLLDSTIATFPETRAPILNLAYFEVLSERLDFPGNGNGGLHAWMLTHPEDATALRLAVNVYVNCRGDCTEDKATLRDQAAAMSQSPDPARSAFGFTMLGDIELGDLRLAAPFTFPRVKTAPYATMHSARIAIEQYDNALALADDPAIYAARAFALRLVGDIPGAIATQQRAVDLMPESATLQLLLADLHLEQRGTTEQILASVETARSLQREVVANALDQGPPRLREFRPIAAFGEVNGLASNLPGEFYGYYMGYGGGRGGGFVVSFDLIPVYGRQPARIDGSNPVERAIGGAVQKSEVLGDPDGVDSILSLQQSILQDASWSDAVTPYDADASRHVAQLVADPESLSFQSTGVGGAASWLRFLGANREAIDLCRSALELGSEQPEPLYRCVAENAYLLGDYETSQDAFETIGDDLMVGYVAERRGDVDEAIRRYERVLESDDEGARGTATLRLADVLLETGDTDGAIALYDEFLREAPLDPACVDTISCPFAPVVPFAQSNRGIARLQSLADDDGTIDCDGEAWDTCTMAFLEFGSALEIDPYNPVFLMNQAWAARLLDDPDLAEHLMTQALQADTSLYPVLNDLGVAAADSGDTSAASRYFLDAAAANPRYDLALWNLGVLHMREGVGGIVRGQAWLARAIVQNPSLVTEAMEFRTDERVYRVEINERLRPGAGWSFGAAASVATIGFGLVTMVLVLAHATYLVVLDKLLEKLNSTVEMRAPWVRERLPRWAPLALRGRWARWVPVAIALAVLTLATTWIARRGDPHAASASVALALFAAALAVATHELGHALAARRLKATIQPAHWAPGTVLALGLFPLGVSAGPYPGQQVVAQSEAASKRVYLAGPMANLAVAIVAYLLFTLQPVPGLRMIAQVQLAAMGYALLPFAPLDGAVLARAHPRLMGVAGGALLLLGVLFTLGIL